MKSRTINNITLLFDPGEEETADLIGRACGRSLQLIEDGWGLMSPDDCRVYVMTSWQGFVFRSAPWHWKILLAATIPFWYGRIQRTWPISAAWTQRYGKRVAIGVKPPRLLAESDRSFGLRIFVQEKDMGLNVQQVTCHELAHACSAHLKLPPWLNEGIATVTADRFLERQTIRQDTLDLIRDFQPKGKPPTYRELSRMRGEAFSYHAVRGYWLTRHLEEERPGFLKRMLSQGSSAADIEREMAVELGIDAQNFWGEIDGVLADRSKIRDGVAGEALVDPRPEEEKGTRR